MGDGNEEWENAPGLLVSIRDITDRRDAEEQARQLAFEQAARTQAEADERRSRFLAEVSHALDSSLEVDTILHRLARLAVTPEEEFEDRTDRRAGFPQLADLCMIDLVEEDGSLRRVAVVHHHPERQALARGALMKEVAGIIQPLATKKNLAFNLRVGTDGDRLITDPGKLRQVVLNLLSNAMKFTEEGEVRLETTRESGHYVIRVSDTLRHPGAAPRSGFRAVLAGRAVRGSYGRRDRTGAQRGLAAQRASRR